MSTAAPIDQTLKGSRHAGFFTCCLLLALFCCAMLCAGADFMTSGLPYFHGKPLPLFTQGLLDHRLWLLAFPLPWMVAAARSVWRRDAQAVQLVKFSATLALALIVLSVYVGLVLALPWMPYYEL